MVQKGERTLWIDSLKGVAILCVVLGHVALGYRGIPMYPEYSWLMTAIGDAVYAFHMPLFFVLSGYMYCKAYVCDDETIDSQRLKRQALNLAVIYAVYSIVYGSFKILFGGYVNVEVTVTDLLMIWAKTIDPYWYLYVLVMFYGAFFPKTVRNAAPGALFAVLLAVSIPIRSGLVSLTSWFQIDRFCNFAVFFYAGYLCARRPSLFQGPRNPLIAVCTILSAAGICGFVLGRAPEYIPVFSTLFPLAFCLTLFWAFSRCKALGENPLLCLCGRYSLEIYVLHNFLTAGLRPVFILLHIDNVAAGIFLNLVISTALPLLFAYSCRLLGIHALFFKPGTFFERKLKKHA